MFQHLGSMVGCLLENTSCSRYLHRRRYQHGVHNNIIWMSPPTLSQTRRVFRYTQTPVDVNADIITSLYILFLTIIPLCLINILFWILTVLVYDYSLFHCKDEDDLEGVIYLNVWHTNILYILYKFVYIVYLCIKPVSWAYC